MHGLGSSKQLKSLNLSKRGLVETKKKKIKKNKKKDKARKVAHIQSIRQKIEEQKKK